MATLETSLVTETVLNGIRRAEGMRNFILQTIPDKIIVDTEEKVLIVALFSLVLEHHGAVLHLLKAGRFDGSALALVRPLIEASYRGHWIYCCATPEAIKQISVGKDAYPKLPRMASDVEKKLGTGGYFAAIVPHLRTLHGYTHGGMEQLARRYDAPLGNVRPTYPDEIKAENIRVTTAHLTALAIAYCQLISQEKSAGADPLAKAISEFYLPVA